MAARKSCAAGCETNGACLGKSCPRSCRVCWPTPTQPSQVASSLQWWRWLSWTLPLLSVRLPGDANAIALDYQECLRALAASAHVADGTKYQILTTSDRTRQRSRSFTQPVEHKPRSFVVGPE